VKKYFNIHVYGANEEFTVLLKVDESKVSDDYEYEDIISLAVELEKLEEEYADIVDSIEEISEEEYRKTNQSLIS
jgi:hypothetical protein